MAVRIICSRYFSPSCLLTKRRLVFPLRHDQEQTSAISPPLAVCHRNLIHTLHSPPLLYHPSLHILPTSQTQITHRYFGSDGSSIKSSENEEPKKLGLFQKFKQMYKEYWYVLLPVHLVTSAAWFGGFYYMAMEGVDIVPILEYFGATETIISPFRNSKAGYLAVAYGLYKIATPARYAVTVGGTTISIKYLRDWGYIKPVPSKEQLKKMYELRKDNLKANLKERYEERKENLKERYEERKENLKERYEEKKENLKERIEEKKGTLKDRLNQESLRVTGKG